MRRHERGLVWVNFPRAANSSPTANVTPFPDVNVGRPRRWLRARNGPEQLQQGLGTDASLLDHLGSLREYVSRYFEANFLGDLETDD